MDIDILKVLPHRFPFLLVDKVLEFKKGEMIRAVKNVSYNDYFFMGHFPEKPIMPGVLIIEAMAQTTGLFLYLSYAEEKENRVAYLAGVDNMKFRKPVFPGDQLILEVKLEKSLQNIFKFHGLGKVEENLAAEGEITIALG